MVFFTHPPFERLSAAGCSSLAAPGKDILAGGNIDFGSHLWVAQVVQALAKAARSVVALAEYVWLPPCASALVAPAVPR